MTKATYKRIEHDGRYYFHDGTGYFLIDTGFGSCSVSLDGRIGPFTASAQSPDYLQSLSDFLDSFMGPARPEGHKVKGILAPMEGYSILFQGETVTIDNDARELPEHIAFIPFLSQGGPILAGKCNGKPMKFFFDSGMRMAVMDDRILTEGKPCLGTIHEWIAPLRCSAEAPYYSAVFEFADGLRFEGHAEFDYSNVFLAEQRRYNQNAFDAFFGIELFRQYDLFISRIPGQEGLAIIKRA